MYKTNYLYKYISALIFFMFTKQIKLKLKFYRYTIKWQLNNLFYLKIVGFAFIFDQVKVLKN